MYLKFNPLLYNELPNINEVSHNLDENDINCINQIKEILQNHNLSDRFGITLLHKHFDVKENEVLVETVDTENRVLTTKPIPIAQTNDNSLVQTVWCFSIDKSLQRKCESFCPTDPDGKHYGYKDHY